MRVVRRRDGRDDALMVRARSDALKLRARHAPDGYVRVARNLKYLAQPRFVRALEIFTDEAQLQLNIVDSTQPVARVMSCWIQASSAVPVMFWLVL